jgi:hypothetical protein
MPFKRFIYVALFACSLRIAAQQPTDVQQLNSVMKDLAEHNRAPSDLIDPQSRSTAKHLDTLSNPFTLALTSQGDPQFHGDGTATVPVRLHFKNDSSELNTSTNVNFVRRGETWYLADLAFLDIPTGLIFVLIIGCLGGVAYAAFVVTISYRLAKKGILTTSNRLRLPIPFYWPSLIRQTR